MPYSQDLANALQRQQQASSFVSEMPEPGNIQRKPDRSVYGIEYRERLYPGEMDFFRKNPNVAGMAADDNKIILNPYSKLSDKEKQAVMMNEASRVHMRRGTVPAPEFDLTKEQQENFKGYSAKIDDVRQTIAARILSGDPSAGNPTPEQLQYVQKLKSSLKTSGSK